MPDYSPTGLAYLTLADVGSLLTAPVTLVYEAATGNVPKYEAAFVGIRTAWSDAGPALKTDPGFYMGASAAASSPDNQVSGTPPGYVWGVAVAIGIFGLALWAIHSGHLHHHHFFDYKGLKDFLV